jgi:hypothetical protein
MDASRPAGDTRKQIREDRVVYTFPLLFLPGEKRRAAMVLVWHSDGRMETHFVPNIEILQECSRPNE